MNSREENEPLLFSFEAGHKSQSRGVPSTRLASNSESYQELNQENDRPEISRGCASYGGFNGSHVDPGEASETAELTRKRRERTSSSSQHDVYYSPYDHYAHPKSGGAAAWSAYREKELRQYTLIGRLGTFMTILGCLLLTAALWDIGFRETQSRRRSDEGSSSSTSSPLSSAQIVATAANSAPVSIIFFLVDDLGSNDIGYQDGTDIPLASPSLAKAAARGLILTSYYSYAECSPSRSALLTGMSASSVGMQHDCITTCDPFGVPSTFQLLPDVLKEKHNYVTAMIGKWDIGHYAKQSWPVERGFDTSLHLSCYGYADYTRHLNLGGYSDLHDGFEDMKEGVDGVDWGSTSDSADSRYSTMVFTKRALNVITTHAAALAAYYVEGTAAYKGAEEEEEEEFAAKELAFRDNGGGAGRKPNPSLVSDAAAAGAVAAKKKAASGAASFGVRGFGGQNRAVNAAKNGVAGGSGGAGAGAAGGGGSADSGSGGVFESRQSAFRQRVSERLEAARWRAGSRRSAGEEAGEKESQEEEKGKGEEEWKEEEGDDDGFGGEQELGGELERLESYEKPYLRDDLLLLALGREPRNRRLQSELKSRGEGKESYPGLFMYVAWNAVHTTLSVPNGYNATSEFEEITANVDMESNPTRALLAGALKQADDGFDSILETLRTEGLYARSVVVVCSDNGGSVDDGGNNWPMRGGKRTLFQGGVNVPSFITSPLLPRSALGTSFDGLVHVSDWLPTLAFGLQGTAMTDAESAQYDGVDQWDELLAGGTTSARSGIECGVDYLIGDGESGKSSGVIAAPFIQNVTGCVVKDVTRDLSSVRYKFIWNEANIAWTYPDHTEIVVGDATLGLPRAGAFLFDLDSDPTETTNLLWTVNDDDDGVNAELESIATELASAFCDYYSGMAPAQWKEKLGFPKQIFAANDNFITYWTTEVDDTSKWGAEDGGSSGLAFNGPSCDGSTLISLIKRQSIEPA